MLARSEERVRVHKRRVAEQLQSYLDLYGLQLAEVIVRVPSQLSELGKELKELAAK